MERARGCFRGIKPSEKMLWTDMLINFGVPKLLGRQLMQRINISIGGQCGNKITSWLKGPHEKTHRASYRLYGLHKIHFGIQDLGLVAQISNLTEGKKC